MVLKDISIGAVSGAPRYVLWCCGGICQDFFTFFQIGSGHTVFWHFNTSQNLTYVCLVFLKKIQEFFFSLCNVPQFLPKICIKYKEHGCSSFSHTSLIFKYHMLGQYLQNMGQNCTFQFLISMKFLIQMYWREKEGRQLI